MKNNLFTIGELSKLYNIPIKTLRYYDEIGLLNPAKVDADSNYRYYTVEQFILVDLIKNSKIMGMSLAEIKELVSGELTVDYGDDADSEFHETISENYKPSKGL
ncbi:MULTISPECIES: MerR family transcriptional regulator [unclassified Lacrimispora]|uniref:MerR family transcriptional regulator n=1 Tax=unclassified Lacrimispora TaxID=2719232 RepID=UPI00377004BC